MTDTPKSLSHGFVTGLVFASLFFGAVGGLGVLFVGDTLFDKTPEDTAAVTRLADELDAARARINALETALAQKVGSAADTTALRAELDELRETATVLGARVETLDTDKTDTHIPLVLLGVTQLNTAFENGQPLDAGIATLTGAIADDGVKKSLSELASAASALVPVDTLITSVEKLRADMAQQAGAKTAQTGNALRDTASTLLHQFVSIRPVDAVNHEKTLDAALGALRAHDLPTARTHLISLPASPAVDGLVTAIDARLNVAGKIRAVIAAVTTTGGAGSLY